MLLGKTAECVCRKGVLNVSEVTKLEEELKRMGLLHKVLGFSMSLAPRLWDHMVGVARLCGDLTLTGAFKVEGRHNPLKREVRNSSFKGGGKGSRLRGVRKGWGESIRNDNLNYNLLNTGCNEWGPASTKQGAYINEMSHWCIFQQLVLPCFNGRF